MDATSESQQRVARYLPRPVIHWLADDPAAAVRQVEGTLVFADVSGFTALSERLAKQGRIGAEILADTISACFARLLGAAYSNGGSLLKFGGDALLLWFTGDDHCRRACSAAMGMRRELRAMGAVEGAGVRTRLGMSVGVHTGLVHMFLVGESHRELVVTGPAASAVVAMESVADRGEILLSPAVAAEIDPSCLGATKGPGLLLRREPRGLALGTPEPTAYPDLDTLLMAVPQWLRPQALTHTEDPQHRSVVVGFLKFSGADGLIESRGAAVAADELARLVADTQSAAEQHGVFLLGSDVDKDGGKLIVAGGAPITSGQDEQSVLLALRQVVGAERLLSVRAGVNVGSTFAGDIGPAYRRTYTVMGDTVNLAARVMARADRGTVLATRPVLGQCRGEFVEVPVEPFRVKGKSHPVHAVVVGPLRHSRRDHEDLRPLIGRDDELQALLGAWRSADAGRGKAVVVTGEPGIGKTRLVDELFARTSCPRVVVTCEPYDANTPYAAARDLLTQAFERVAGEPIEETATWLAGVVATRAPFLADWLPLIGLVLDLDLPPTKAVRDLDEQFLSERIEETFVDLLSVLLPEPVVLHFEDAHCMDGASSSLIRRLIGRIRDTSWLATVARREGPGGLEVVSGTDVTTIPLGPLHETAALVLAETMTDSGSGAAAHLMSEIVERAGGNPLFIGELIAGTSFGADPDEIPESLEAVILARIDGLSPEDRSLLRRLSVFGGTFPQSLAREVLGDALPARGNAAWRRLADFVDLRSGDRLAFRHSLVRDGAYNSLPFRVREALHANVADAIQRRAGDAVAEHAAMLSMHFFRARRHVESWRYSLLAAQRAQTVFANAETARFYERALEAARRGAPVERADLLNTHESLGDTFRRMGRLRDAETAYRTAHRLADADPAVVSRLMLKRAGVRQQEGAFTQALRWLRAAERELHLVGGDLAARQLGRVAVARASIAKDQRRPRSIVRWCQAALRQARPIDDTEVLAHALFLLDHGYVALGQSELAVHSEKALDLYAELDNLWGQGAVLNNMGGHAYWAGRWEEAVELYERGRLAFERIGDVCNAAIGLVNIGEIRSDQGRLAEAEPLLERARLMWERSGDRANAAYATSNLGRLATRSRRFTDALELLETARAVCAEGGQTNDALESAARIVECYCHAGDVQSALAEAERLLERPAALGETLLAMLHRLVGYAHLQRGALAPASHALTLSLDQARGSDAAYETALTLRAIGHLTAAEGGDGGAHLAEAQQILTGLGVVAVDEPLALSAAVTGPAIPAQASSGASDPVAS